MRTFFLFYLLSYFLRSPLLAILIIVALFYFGEARYHGRYFNPSAHFAKRNTLRELQRTVAVNEHDVGAHNDLGRLLAEDERFDRALPHMERAIGRMEESAETNFYYGLCLLKTGRVADGESYMLRALEISPHFLYGDGELAVARHFAEAGKIEESLEHARKSVRINTSSVEGWLLVGRGELGTGNESSAREAFERALSAYNDLPHYLRLAARKPRAAAKRGLRSLC